MKKVKWSDFSENNPLADIAKTCEDLESSVGYHSEEGYDILRLAEERFKKHYLVQMKNIIDEKS